MFSSTSTNRRSRGNAGWGEVGRCGVEVVPGLPAIYSISSVIAKSRATEGSQIARPKTDDSSPSQKVG